MEKLGNQDKSYLDAMLLKIKINAKKSMMNKISKIVNKDRMSGSSEPSHTGT